MDDRVWIALDTAAPIIGVAAWRAGEVVRQTARVQRGAEGTLVPWVHRLIEELGADVSDVAGVACTRGPGAFTGLRVGLSTAVGLAMGLRVPLWTCDTLFSRAMRVVDADRVLAVLDARKGRVYAATYLSGERVGPITDSVPEDIAEAVKPETCVTGEGALVYRALWEAAGARVHEDAEDAAVDTLVHLAREALERGEGMDPADVHPLYIRRPDARTTAERSAGHE